MLNSKPSSKSVDDDEPPSGDNKRKHKRKHADELLPSSKLSCDETSTGSTLFDEQLSNLGAS
jgi:hypothetical protein